MQSLKRRSTRCSVNFLNKLRRGRPRQPQSGGRAVWADGRLALDDTLSLLEGGLDHELVQRGTLQPRRLLQRVPEFRRHAGGDATLVFNGCWHSFVWLGAILPPVDQPAGDQASPRLARFSLSQ